MDNLIEGYQDLKDKVNGIAKKYQSDLQSQKFEEHLDSKLSSFNPAIMMYGVYNAGKSTLLNAIFGQNEMAKTGDAPETSVVEAYSYHGYTIYDTPGINAPIEHQLVTEEHLSKCELIVFVLSNSGSFEERYIYERIGEVIQADKPILIALNNKMNIDMDSLEAQREIDKVNYHLSTICESIGIKKAEEKVSFVFLDAKTALEGKLEEDVELIEESNIEHFENVMNELLGQSGKAVVVNALNLYISNYINDTLTLIDENIDNPELKKTQELITYLEKIKQRTLIELRDISLQSMVTITSKLLEFLLARDKKGIDELVKKSIEDINQKIQHRMTELQNELQAKVEQFKIDFKQICLDTPEVIAKSEDSDVITHSEKHQDNKQSIATTGMSLATVIPPHIVVPTPFGPVPVKVLAMIAATLLGAFSGSSEARVRAEAELDAKRAMYLSARNNSDTFGADLKEKLYKNINDNVNQLFTGVIQQYIEFSEKLDRQNTELLNDKRKLQAILQKL